MAFVFRRPTETAFWMKDTLFPLSIAFWDARGRIVDMADMAVCRASRCPLYRASQPYVGALEVNRGYFKRYGVHIGDVIRLDQRSCQ
jgi:uncharacterized membrane protein (UPF0127 family)